MAHFLETICPHFVKNAAWCNPVFIFGTKETKDNAKVDDVKDVLDPGPGTSKGTKGTKEIKKRKRAKKSGAQKKKAKMALLHY